MKILMKKASVYFIRLSEDDGTKGNLATRHCSIWLKLAKLFDGGRSVHEKKPARMQC
jgi:hypothetical protein